MTTRDRVLEAALVSFGTRGYEATSLDQVAAELGIRKQTILYYYPSKAELLDAVVDLGSASLVETLEAALSNDGTGWDRLEAIIRSVFRLALRRPELLGLLREVSRLGAEPAARLTDNLDPLVNRAREFLEAEMAALGDKGVRFSAVEEPRWGSVTKFRLPGGSEIGLYHTRLNHSDADVVLDTLSAQRF